MDKMIILDRDGVLNKMVIDAEHGTIDSPLNPTQVDVPAFVPKALKDLTDLGFKLAIATNQPSAAKGKTTKENLQAVHDKVLRLIDAPILSSHICWHKKEDGCTCRKPKPGLLEEALKQNRISDLQSSWMVGDGITDLQAGRAAGLNVAFIAPQKDDHRTALLKQEITPDIWAENLADFVEKLRALRP